MFKRKARARQLNQLSEIEELVAEGKPVLLDFFQFGCPACQVMDGIMNELARDYGDTAHIVKVNVGRVPGAAQMFNVRSTPTMVLLGTPPAKKGKKGRDTTASGKVTVRWRTAGLVQKNQLSRVLEGNGAVAVTG
jgi:thioredoxin 1